jgi:cytochrome c556
VLKRALLYAAAVMAAPGAGGLAADPAAGEPGWTGVSDPNDVIAARQGLMAELERLMQPLDSFTAGENVAVEVLRSNATTLSSLLAVLPHLFPPTTNLYDAAAAQPVTIALPAIWESFPAFYALADAATQSAADMAEKRTPEQLAQAATRLRASCDACHTPYLRAYVPEAVNDSDKEFDFDSVFK